MVFYIAILMFSRWEVCGSKHASKSLIRVIFSDLWLLAKKRNGNQWNHKISLAFLSHLWGYDVSAIINILLCSKCCQLRKLFHDSAAVVFQGDLQSQAMVRAVARQVCEQLIQGKYTDSPHASLSGMDLFLPQLLTNMTLCKISKEICLF